MVQRPVLREHCELFRVAETQKVWRPSKASGEIARKTARSTGVLLGGQGQGACHLGCRITGAGLQSRKGPGDTHYGPDHKQVHKAVSAQAGQGSSVPVRQEEQWEPQQKEAVQMGSWSPEECAGSL